MIMDDHEIRDDWGDKNSDRDQDTKEFFVARCGYRVFCEYQGQLQGDCLDDFMSSKQHRIFKIGSHTGVVLADMRAARTFNYQENDPNVVLGTPQWHEIDNALADDGVLADCDTLIFGTGYSARQMTLFHCLSAYTRLPPLPLTQHPTASRTAPYMPLS